MQTHHYFSRKLRSCQKKRWEKIGSETLWAFEICVKFQLFVFSKTRFSPRFSPVAEAKRFQESLKKKRMWHKVTTWRQRVTPGKSRRKRRKRKKTTERQQKRKREKTALSSWVWFEPICRFKLPYENDQRDTSESERKWNWRKENA